MSEVRYVETKSLHTILRTSVWSNVAFLVPLYFAFHFENIILSILIGSVICASLAYHIFSEDGAGILLNIDRTFASILTLFNAILIAFGGFTQPFFQIVAVLVLLDMFLFRGQRVAWERRDSSMYEGYHGLWHLMSATITMLSILTFYF